MIENHNAMYGRGETSYTMGVNQFADMTKAEFKETLLTRKPGSPRSRTVMTAAMINASAVPDAIDWRIVGRLLPSRTRVPVEVAGRSPRKYGAAAIESAYYLKNKQMQTFSEQELIDCSTAYGNHGCSGGFMQDGFQYAIENGISTVAEYPYTATDEVFKTHKAFAKVSSYVDVEQTENALKSAVVTIYVDDMAYYTGGVYDNPNCPNTFDKLDHEVLLIGYGTEGGKDYWLIKNSWGTTWGESGYAKMSRNSNNQCGIAVDAAYPIVA
ncbi:hypothetical protein NQ318_004755 [Aromia moschata]|uniref:Peptidase C1A papain C-terminal domain-containing protein n=1 Tax=Aromia moschata TaxID=1265417 RepID=A0AAV8XWK2_9CUCU|nr:hypothetical protein NQ318_004755 [Aromia moschata]